MNITGNGQSEYINLYRRITNVHVYYVGGAAGTLTPQVGVRKGEVIAQTLPNGDTTITASTSFSIEGPGLLSFDASGVSGTIKIDIDGE